MVVISGVISPLICIVTLLITPFITTHEPPSKLRAKPSHTLSTDKSARNLDHRRWLYLFEQSSSEAAKASGRRANSPFPNLCIRSPRNPSDPKLFLSVEGRYLQDTLKTQTLNPATPKP